MIAFSFSPGGLLLPYHLGVLAALSYHGFVTPDTPLAGSSAGAIAVASHAAGVPTHVALEASLRISSQCNPFFLAQGQLMPSLHNELASLFPRHVQHIVNERPGVVGLAHLQLYPQRKPVLATQDFETKQDLMEAVCDSSMFPYFTSNQPFRIVPRSSTASGTTSPRIVVDGVFTEPLWRFGCPNLKRSLADLDRSVSISVFPKELVGLGWTHAPRNVIAPPLQEAPNVARQITQLGLLMCTPGRRKDLTNLYENGWKDAERWVHNEKNTAQEPVRLPKMPCVTSDMG